MRAEAQAHADQINAAIALLRRFLDWDLALKRLDELNARKNVLAPAAVEIVDDPDGFTAPKQFFSDKVTPQVA